MVGMGMNFLGDDDYTPAELARVLSITAHNDIVRYEDEFNKTAEEKTQ